MPKRRNPTPSVTTTIRLPPEELVWLKEFSRRNGVSVSGMFRTAMRVALGVPGKEREMLRRFDEQIKQLTGVARNLNQMTRAANSGKLRWDSGAERRIAVLEKETRATLSLFWQYRRIVSLRGLPEAVAETAALDNAAGWIASGADGDDSNAV